MANRVLEIKGGRFSNLVALDRIDTAPISVSGLSADRTVTVDLVMPSGVVPLGPSAVDVTITLRAVTATRNFEVGLQLVGTDPDLVYRPATDRVLITVGGSVTDLDRLTGATLVAELDVSQLGLGTSDAEVTADLPPGLTLVSASPAEVSVTVSALASPSPPSPSPAGAPAATASPSPGG